MTLISKKVSGHVMGFPIKSAQADLTCVGIALPRNWGTLAHDPRNLLPAERGLESLGAMRSLLLE